MSDNTFKFVMPAELEKAEDGNWKVRGLASTQGIDQQGETIIQKGVDLSPIDQKRGVLNWDHKKGPENTIGVLDGYSRGQNGLYVEGRLFKNHTKAKAVKEIMESLGESDRGRMGLSVEGQILERDPSNPKIIKKCKINAVALTMNPVNTSTYASLIKSMSESEIEVDSVEEHITGEINKDQATFTADQVVAMIQKALGMDGGYTKAPSELKDGDALATSDMKPEKKKKKKEDYKMDETSVAVTQKAKDPCWEGYKRTLGTKKYEEGSCMNKALKPMSKDLYKSSMLKMMDKLQKLHPDCSRQEIWEAVKERMETKFPDIYSAKEE